MRRNMLLSILFLITTSVVGLFFLFLWYADSKRLTHDVLHPRQQDSKSNHGNGKQNEGHLKHQDRFDEEWWERMETVQMKRKARLRKICRDLYGQTLTNTSQLVSQKSNLGSLVVDHKYHVVYSVVYKVSSSAWLYTFASDLAGCKVMPGQFVYNHPCVKWLKDFDERNETNCLEHYRKFIFVRNPLSRIVSAYKDKFIEYFNTYYANVSEIIINAHRKDHTNNSTRPTFNEFISYLVASKQNRYDPHWISIYDNNRPCEIDYDIIGKLEDAYDDIPYVLKKVGIWNVTGLGKENYRRKITGDEEIRKFFANVPRRMLHQIYRIYEEDFTVFGYDRNATF